MHVKVHDSVRSSLLSPFVSPLTKVTGEHLSSLTETVVSGTLPVFVTTNVYVTGPPGVCTAISEAVFSMWIARGVRRRG